ncbi:gonadotropin-releasing hormone II receptor [Ixodes scapularis]|uniref:gonadotropin-releasing hormone II receptor n=1 Tax=Ixodes scapularis TaxID=6945 RepID=UPI001C38DA59|nr:gonadotropin-releasing hormone II receptor [Ixodes scapularis]
MPHTNHSEESSEILLDVNHPNWTDPGQQLFPEELTFNTQSLVQVIVYAVLFVTAATGNIPVFFSLMGKRHRKSRLKVMIMHLAIADLIVTFVMIPLEVGWRLTVQWTAGNVMCKVMQVLRAFGPYLSSMVLVCISLDRYFAVLHPLKVNDAQRRGRIMLSWAWITSFLCSVPQAIIFHVMEHPQFPEFEQCVTFASFPSSWHERLYNLFCLLALYGLPLAAIIVCYSRIFWEIHRQSRDPQVVLLLDDLSKQRRQFQGRMRLRRSDMRHMQRARNRTLRLTIIIVLAFFWCWTPYVTMVLWYQFDPDGAEHVNGYLQSSLFMFAVSNSCVNPLVYGSYTLTRRRFCVRCPFFGARDAKTAPMIVPEVKPVVLPKDKTTVGDNSLFSSDSSVYPYELTIRFKGQLFSKCSKARHLPDCSCESCALSGRYGKGSKFGSSSLHDPKQTSSPTNHSM